MTDSNGKYLFSNVQPNTDYVVYIDQSNSVDLFKKYTLTSAFSGDSTRDSNAATVTSPLNAANTAFLVDAHTNATTDLTFDFGLLAKVTIGDYVWLDSSRDGIQQSGEEGIAGVVLSLYQNNSGVLTLVSTTTTNADGLYLFGDNVVAPNRNYVVVIDLNNTVNAGLLSTYTISAPSVGQNNAEDSNGVLSIDSATGHTFDSASVRITTTGDDTIDFAFQPSLAIGDYVFYDMNSNGIQDAGDLPIAGVVLELRNSQGVLLATTTTSADGLYSFSSADGLVASSSYTIRVQLGGVNSAPLSGYVPTYTTVPATTTSSDSDGSLQNINGINYSVAPATTGASGSYVPTYDFGFRPQLNISSLIFLDTNADGTKQTTEPGIPNVVVELQVFNQTTGTYVTVTTTTTDSNGQFTFENVDPRTPYRLVTRPNSNTPLQPLVPTTPNQGSDLTDSDGLTTTVNGQPVVYIDVPIITSSNSDSFFGFRNPVSIGDYVWQDSNVDGLQQANESPIVGVKVTLYKLDPATGFPTYVSETTTDSNGLYNFPNVDPNSVYSVVIDPTSAVNAPLLSNQVPTLVNLASPATNSDGKLTTTTVIDQNGNVVTLNNVDLAAVSVKASTITDVDFGFRNIISIGDYVFVDSNNNGIQDGTDYGIPNLSLDLLKVVGSSSVVVASNFTTGNGYYIFTNVDPNTDYVVRIDLKNPFNVITLSNYAPTTDNVPGSGDDVDSDGVLVSDPITGQRVAVIAPVQIDTTDDFDVDFGFSPKIYFTDLVWADNITVDGLRNSGEMGIAGVTVQLYALNPTTGQYDTLVGTTVTDDTGRYYFEVSRSTQYQVVIVLTDPVNASPLDNLRPTFSNTNNNNNDDIDSDGQVVTVSPTTQYDVATFSTSATSAPSNVGSFGFRPEISLGDFVFLDSNNNGIQDAGEQGISGVVVSLYDVATSTVIQTATTDANGKYLFTDLAPSSSYKVVIDLVGSNANLANIYKSSPANQNNDDFVDSDGVLSSSPITSGSMAIVADVDVVTTSINYVDFGLTPKLTIGDFIFADVNNNGVQDPSEVGFAGVSVSLYKVDPVSGTTTLVFTTVTDSEGKYTFTEDNGVTPNTEYSVVIPLNANNKAILGASSTPSTANVAGSTDQNDSDGILTFDNTLGVFVLAAPVTLGNTATKDVDFGFVPSASLGDYVWFDLNRDGLQDGENGIEGVKVELVSSTGSVVADTMTNKNGYYLFTTATGLAINTPFTVRIPLSGSNSVVLKDYLPTVAFNQPAGDNSVGSLTTLNGLNYITSPIVSVPANSSLLTVDFGFVQQLYLDSSLFVDSNSDGVRQTTELPLANVFVSVLKYNPNTLAYELYTIVKSDNTGSVHVPVDPNTQYILSVDLNNNSNTLNGLTPTTPNVGSDDTKDSDGKSDGSTDIIEVSISTTSSKNNDFGFRPRLFIGDYVFADTNLNGVQDAGDSGATVALFLYVLDPTTNTYSFVSTTNSGTDGKYQFEVQPQLTYQVQIPTPSGFTPVTPNVGNDDTKDSDGVDAGTYVYAITTVGNTNDFTVDFGFRVPLFIFDVVFLDVNKDGLYDPTVDTPISGVVVTLYTPDPVTGSLTPVGSSTTNPDGIYQFSVSPNTKYVVQVDLTSPSNTGISNLLPTTSNVNNNANDNNDSDGLPLTDNTGTVVLTYVPITVTSSIPLNQATFGLRQRVFLGDYVWFDANSDGKQTLTDPVETRGIANVRVELFTGSSSVSVQFTYTDSNGYYLFEVQPYTSYRVRVDLDNIDNQVSLAGLVPTYANVNNNANDNVDSDGVKSVDPVSQHTVSSTSVDIVFSDDLTNDFGFRAVINVGDYVWVDTNANGIQDATESGIAGVTVLLYNAQTKIVEQVATTGSDGKYYFNDVLPFASYQAVIELSGDNANILNPYKLTSIFQGSLGNDSNGFDATSPITPSVAAAISNIDTLDVNDYTYDFGFTPRLSIGDFVWVDSNFDGLQQSQESGIAGVTVQLFTVDPVTGTVTFVAEDVTDSNGKYLFSDDVITPNTQYIVKIDLNDNVNSIGSATPTRAAQGSDPSVDSNGVPSVDPATQHNVVTATVTVQNSYVDNVDFGFVPALSLGDYVWVDADSNGLQSADEVGIANVLVELYSVNGNVDTLVSTTFTNTLGYYLFTDSNGLRPQQNYKVIVPLDGANVQPLTGLVPTFTKIDANKPTLDSDASVVGNDFVASAVSPSLNAADLTYDFGFRPLLSIGSLVFLDSNSDGVQQPGEPGIAGVQVFLYQYNPTTGQYDIPVGTTVSQPDGSYLFQNVQPFTNYRFVVDPTSAALTGLTPTTPNVGSDTSDSDGVAGLINGIFLVTSDVSVVNTPVTHNDFGFRPVLSIGDFVFLDANVNGLQDGSDLPISFTTVTLYAQDPVTGSLSFVGQSTTDTSGKYTFNNVAPYTTYKVVVGLDQFLVDKYPTLSDTNPANSAVNSDGVFFSGVLGTATDGSSIVLGSSSVATAVVTSSSLTDVDFGFRSQIVLGDTVFFDSNADGSLNNGEQGIRNVIVNLLVKSPSSNTYTVVATTSTDAQGNYFFNNVSPKTDYQIVIDLSSAANSATLNNLVPTFSNAFGVADSADSDGILSSDKLSDSITLTTGIASDLTNDFGFRNRVFISDVIFTDSNINGLRDQGEPVIPGVLVKLYSQNPLTGVFDVLVGSTTTDNNGVFTFEVQPNTPYQVRVDLNDPQNVSPLDKLTPTTSNVNNNNNENNDSDGQFTVLTTTPLTPSSVVTLTTSTTTQPNTASFGFRPVLSLGDYVFVDTNNDGLQDSTDVPIAKVVMSLVDPATLSVLRTTTTDSNGFYLFDNVDPNTRYTVIINKQGSNIANVYDLYVPAKFHIGSNGLVDSDGQLFASYLTSGVDAVVADTTIFTSSYFGVDFGFLPRLSIGDYVWLDANNDGIQETNEPGLVGLIVSLYSYNPTTNTFTLVSTTTSDTNGKYLFNDNVVQPNTQYQVRIDLNNPFNQQILSGATLATTSAPGSTTDNDSNGVLFTNPTTGAQSVVGNVSLGTTPVNNVDFGFVAPIVIGDYVWSDANRNGIQDAGEMGIAGVSVQLVSFTGGVLDTTVTDSDGYYIFRSNGILRPQTSYSVRVPLAQSALQNYIVSPANQGTDNAVDSDGVTVTINGQSFVQTSVVTGAAPYSDLTNDFGFSPRLTFTTKVFFDSNSDGLQTGETGISSVIVDLFKVDPITKQLVYVSSTTTDANGMVSFEVMPNTDYRVVVDSDKNPTTLGSYVTTLPNQGNNDSIDSDSVPSVNTTNNHVLSVLDVSVSTTSVTNNDFGFRPSLTLGDYVWVDRNGDGVQQSNETGLAGVVVSLYKQSSSGAFDLLVDTTTTDSNGKYMFTVQPNTAYQVSIDLMDANNAATLASYVPTSPMKGTSTSADSNGVRTQTMTSDVVSSSPVQIKSASDNTVDFGFVPQASIGVNVWFDNNADGIYTSSTEPGIPNVVLKLQQYDPTTNTWNTLNVPVVRNNQGQVLFNNVPSYGQYRVIVDLSDPINQLVLANTIPTIVGAGNVRSLDSDGVPQVDPTTGNPIVLATVTLTGSSDVSTGFGFVPSVQVGDYVWVDSNSNGVQESTESPIANVLVELYKQNTNTGALVFQTSVLTNATGQYTFNVYPGSSYQIRVDLDNTFNAAVLRNLTATTSNVQTTSESSDSDGVPTVDTVTGHELDVVNFKASTTNFDLGDFGFSPIVTISGLAWIDSSSDGIRQTTETLLPGVTVTLYNPTTKTVEGVTTTDSTGRYTFVGKPNTNYLIIVDTTNTNSVPLSGLAPTTPRQGGNNAVDSDGVPSTSPVTGSFSSIINTTTSSSPVNNLDFGFKPLFSIGDFVWVDSSRDGIQQPDEMGLAGVVVQLFRVDPNTGNNVFVATTTTSSSGLYTFDSSVVSPNTQYIVQIDLVNNNVALSGLTPSPSAQGTDSTRDSNGVPATDATVNHAVVRAVVNTGSTPSSTTSRDVDFGFSPSFVLGDYVFVDTNSDGIQNANDVPLAGVLVQLTTATGTSVIDTTLTGNNGYYYFSSQNGAVKDGTTTYRTSIPLSGDNTQVLAGFVPTLSLVGNDRTVDSSGLTTTLNGQQVVYSDSTASSALNLANDFGFRRLVTIGSNVWVDTNGDGIRSPTEAGIPNVLLVLYQVVNGSYIPVGTTTSDSTGSYSFNNVDPLKQYVVSIPLNNNPALSNYDPTSSKQGNDPTKDSDASYQVINGVPTSTLPVSFVTPLSNDAGFKPKLFIGDYVWIDSNADGQQQTSESGVSGIVVTLLKLNPTTGVYSVVSTTTTDVTGKYLFDSISVSTTYRVAIFNDANNRMLFTTYTPTTTNALGLSGQRIDSDGSLLTLNGVSASVADVSIAFQSSFDIDFGFRKQVSVSGSVFSDPKSTGLQSLTTPSGIPGVVVTLSVYNPTTDTYTVVGSTSTGSDGSYVFDKLDPNTQYTVYINTSDPRNVVALGNNVLTFPNVNGNNNDNVDSDGIPRKDPNSNSILSVVTVTPGAPGSNTVSFGYRPLLTIGDYVWVDVNGNGVQDSNEAGLPGVTVQLVNPSLPASAQVVSTTSTGSNGQFSFNVDPNTFYKIVIELSGANTGTSLNLNDYLVSPAFQATESTDSNGKLFVSPINSASLAVVSDVQVGTSSINTVDFGFVPRFSIGDFVWVDINMDGVQQPSEPGIVGLVVELYEVDPITGISILAGTTSTSSSGNYLFDSSVVLANRNYRVQINLNNTVNKAILGSLALSPFQTGPSNLDSDAVLSVDPTTGNRLAVVNNIVTGSVPTSQRDKDIGFIPTLVIGDYVWFDSNNNGLQDASESGISNVMVQLVDSIGQVVSTKFTDSNGLYYFSNSDGLRSSSTYFVRVPLLNNNLDGLNPTLATQGSNTAVDSNGVVFGDFARTSVTTGVSGSDFTIDFGFSSQLFITSIVWFDSVPDGIRQPGEPLLSNVIVTLTSPNGLTMTTVTDPTGRFTFNNLPPNTVYTISVTTNPAVNPALANTVTTVLRAGSNPAIDNDASTQKDPVTGFSVGVVTISLGRTSSNNNDFGFKSNATVCDYTWSSWSQCSKSCSSGTRTRSPICPCDSCVQPAPQVEVEACNVRACSSCGFNQYLLVSSTGEVLAPTTYLESSYVAATSSVTFTFNSRRYNFTASRVYLSTVAPTSLADIQQNNKWTRVQLFNPASGLVSFTVPITVPDCANIYTVVEATLANGTSTITVYAYTSGTGLLLSTMPPVRLIDCHVCAQTAPTASPVAPTQAPVAAPTQAPVTAPTQAPVAVPTQAPVTTPVTAPTQVPTAAPTIQTTGGVGGPFYTVSGLLWVDANNNGVYETGELLLGGKTVYLVKTSTGEVVAQTVTKADGSFEFPQVPVDSYQVVIPVSENGLIDFIATLLHQGTNPNTDSDIYYDAVNDRLIWSITTLPTTPGGFGLIPSTSCRLAGLVVCDKQCQGRDPVTISAMVGTTDEVCVSVTPTAGTTVGHYDYVTFSGFNNPIMDTTTTITKATDANGNDITSIVKTETYWGGRACTSVPGCAGVSVNTNHQLDLQPGDINLCFGCSASLPAPGSVKVCFSRPGLTVSEFENSVVKVKSSGLQGFCNIDSVKAVAVMQRNC
eukprot:TRINITY_DN1851_c0_g1_i10.p1 TRINITY_DN1851_c0_g1~~TRINITY_DN1851_c0_g1_i10.p1  ORF type:complete len:5571 (-),score=1863.18 TRINITY_DN1851_c0_g1_i10:137-16849(-)